MLFVWVKQGNRLFKFAQFPHRYCGSKKKRVFSSGSGVTQLLLLIHYRTSTYCCNQSQMYEDGELSDFLWCSTLDFFSERKKKHTDTGLASFWAIKLYHMDVSLSVSLILQVPVRALVHLFLLFIIPVNPPFFTGSLPFFSLNSKYPSGRWKAPCILIISQQKKKSSFIS